MSSGFRKLKFNTRERAISSDLNRAQDLSAYALGNLVRCFSGAMPQPEFQGGLRMDFTPAKFPDATGGSDVLSGLLVRPGTSSVFIDPGTVGIWMYDFPAGADDENYLVFDSAGISTLGEMPFVSNSGGGGQRLDLICARVASAETVLESSSRDIYNEVSGEFTAAVVQKLLRYSLEFVYVTGVAGGAIPAVPTVDAAARNYRQVPLAVVSVPTTATGFDNCDFYDVRPLLPERLAKLPDASLSLSASGRMIQRGEKDIEGVVIMNAGETDYTAIQWGYAVIDAGPYRLGGALRKNVPAASAAKFGDTSAGAGEPADVGGEYANLVVNDPEMHCIGPGAPAAAANDMASLVLAMPAGYDRFVRYTQQGTPAPAYTDIGSGRVPHGANGVWLVVSKTLCGYNGFGFSTGTAPAPLGTGAFTYVWVTDLLHDTVTGGAGNVTPTRVSKARHDLYGSLNSGGLPAVSGTYSSYQPHQSILGTFPGTTIGLEWRLRPGGLNRVTSDAVPCRAKAIWVQIQVNLILSGSNNLNLMVYSLDHNPGSPSITDGSGVVVSPLEVYAHTTSFTKTLQDLRIPLLNSTPTYGNPTEHSTYVMMWLTSGATFETVTYAYLTLRGFEE